MDNDNFLNFKIKAIRSLIAHILFLGCFCFFVFFQFHLTPFVHFLCPTDPSKCTKFNIKSQFNIYKIQFGNLLLTILYFLISVYIINLNIL